MNRTGMQIVKQIIEEERKSVPTVSQDPWRLKFHLMPPTGWLNDPNGLCQAEGVYHVFFQYSPFSAKGGDKYWGHYSSRNLVDWEYLGVPLVTDEPFDRDGVYSGSALVEKNRIAVYYTGNVKRTGRYDYILDGREATVVLTKSEDGKRFKEKEALLTFRDYPLGYTRHIRDPKVFVSDGRRYMVLGGRKCGKGEAAGTKEADAGAVLLYESEDGKRWELRKELMVPDFGYMWECPDLFRMEGGWFLSVSPQGLERGKYAFQNVYASGYFRMDGGPDGPGGLSDFEEWDKGFDFYAPQTFQDELGRRILIGWAGLPDIEEEYLNPTVESGWQHALTVPRQVTKRDGKLLQAPVPELEALRGAEMEVMPGRETVLDDAFDLQFCNREGKAPFSVTIAGGLRLSYDGKRAVLAFTDRKEQEPFSGIGRGRTERRARIEEVRTVRVLADTSLVEIYLNEGERVFTTRYYPEGPKRSILLEGDLQDVRCWRMHGMRIRMAEAVLDGGNGAE